MNFGKRQAFIRPAALDAATSHSSHFDIIMIASCSAAALISSYILAELIWPMLDIPEELRPFGGVRLDVMPPATRPWAPKYVAPAIIAIVSFVVWRYFAMYGRKPGVIRGAVAMSIISMLSIVTAFQVLYVGQFVQMWPMMNSFVDIGYAFLASVLNGLGNGAAYILFFAITMIPASMIIGGVVGGITRLANRLSVTSN